VLSAAGLPIDLVGAVLLALGLFCPPRMLYPGYVRSSLDAAEDWGYGVGGASLLATGFVLQSLQYLGVRHDTSAGKNAVAAGTALVVAAGVGYVLFGVAYVAAVEWYKRHGHDHGLAFRPGFPRFWRYQLPN
jgi:hypothetical protein